MHISIKQAIDNSVNPSIDHSIHISVNWSTDGIKSTYIKSRHINSTRFNTITQSIDQSIDRSTNKVNQPNNYATDQSINQSMTQSRRQSTNPTINQPINQSMWNTREQKYVQMRWTQHAIVRCEDSPNTHGKNKDTTNKLLEPMLWRIQKDAWPMSVPTTRATTHVNNKQHGTRKRIEKNKHTHTHTHALKSDYELNKNKGKLRLRKINV